MHNKLGWKICEKKYFGRVFMKKFGWSDNDNKYDKFDVHIGIGRLTVRHRLKNKYKLS